MIKTIRETIVEKYVQLQNDLKPLLNEKVMSLFPSLDDYDVSDLLLYVQYQFFGSNNYRETLANLVETSIEDIDDDTIELVVDNTIPFIDFLFSIK